MSASGAAFWNQLTISGKWTDPEKTCGDVFALNACDGSDASKAAFWDNYGWQEPNSPDALAVIGSCTESIFGVSANSFTATTPSAAGLFSGNGWVATTGENTDLVPHSTSFTVANTPLDDTAFLQTCGKGAGGCTERYNYLNNYVMGQGLSPTGGIGSMIGTPMYELGNSLGLITYSNTYGTGLIHDLHEDSFGYQLQHCVFGKGATW